MKGKMTNKELKRWYESFNRKYFHNKLPKNTIVEFKKIVPCGETKRRMVESPKPCKCCGLTPLILTFVIYVNSNIQHSRSLTIPTLLHEMIHVEHWEWRGHGRHFNKRMLQLAKAGAFNGWW